ncbi:hypothetical protein V2J09_003404 [Rumex salicifolius]
MDAEGGREEAHRTGSVKAAIHMFGEKMMLESNSSSSPIRKPYHKINFLQKPPSKAREMHLVRQSISDLNENRAAESKAQVEMELLTAKKTVKSLASQIEESASRAKMNQTELLRLNDMSKLNVLDDQEADKLRTELESLKGELSKMSVEIELVKEQTRRANEEAEISNSKKESYLKMVESLCKEIDEVNEEMVLVELAAIEALKELHLIEEQRRDEAKEYSSSMEEVRAKMNEMMDGIDSTSVEEIKDKLSEVESDINMLETEMASLKEMKQGIGSNLDNYGANLQELFLEWKLMTERVEEGKKNLAFIRRNGFEIMAMMDVIRREKLSIVEEIYILKKIEEKSDKTVKSLNSKLIRARNKVESISIGEEKTKIMLSSFMTTLNQLKKDKEAKNEERKAVMEETESVKMETKRIESETNSAQERLQAALQDLEEIGSSELAALEKLKCLTETTMAEREAASKHRSTITISKFEYEYLCGSAASAQEAAGKKVEAAEQWIIALKASEREAKARIVMVEKEIGENKLKEEQEILLSAKEAVNDQRDGLRRRKSSEANYDDGGKMTPSMRSKVRRSITSPASKHMSPRSTSFTVKRRLKVMPVIAKYFASMNVDRESSFEQE